MATSLTRDSVDSSGGGGISEVAATSSRPLPCSYQLSCYLLPQIPLLE